MSFSEKLQKLRKANKLSQEGLAELLDVTRQSVSKWESGQTYPEMDKLLAMCKIFKCSLDDLTNDEITDVKIEEKKKGNLNTLVDSILDFISKTFELWKRMSRSEILKCILFMILLSFVLIIFRFPFSLLEEKIGIILHYCGSGVIVKIISEIVSFIIDVAYFAIYIILYVYIFRMTYLENEKYQNREIVQKEEQKEEIPKQEEKINESKPKKQRMEKVYHSGDAFLHFLSSAFLVCLKIFVIFCSIPIIFLLFGLCMGLGVTIFLLFKKVCFISLIIGIPFSILLVILVLHLIFHFIIGKKLNEKRFFITFLIALIGLGISFGLLLSDISSISYVNKAPVNEEIETVTKIYPMEENLQFYFGDTAEYIVDETLENQIKVEVEHYKEYTEVFLPPEMYSSHVLIETDNITAILDRVIKDLSKRKLYNYEELHTAQIRIYGSSVNIEKLKDNYEKERKKLQEQDREYNYYVEEIERYEKELEQQEIKNQTLNETIDSLNEQIEEKDREVEEYKQKLEEYKNKMKDIISEE